MPSQVLEIQRFVDGTGLRKHQSLAPLLQPLCPCFQRFTADTYALIVGPPDIGSIRAPDRCGPPFAVALVKHSEQASIKRLTVSFIVNSPNLALFHFYSGIHMVSRMACTTSSCLWWRRRVPNGD